MSSYKNILAYKKAYELALKIFAITKKFPVDERYSLTGQIRRSSRSVCANIAESIKRGRYKDYYISKLNDCETENVETEVWLDFAKDCSYINVEEHRSLVDLNNEVGKLVWLYDQQPR
jgi:four helix bundle protein